MHPIQPGLCCTWLVCLSVLGFNIPFNNFSVMLGCFLGINQYSGKLTYFAYGQNLIPPVGIDLKSNALPLPHVAPVPGWAGFLMTNASPSHRPQSDTSVPATGK